MCRPKSPLTARGPSLTNHGLVPCRPAPDQVSRRRHQPPHDSKRRRLLVQRSLRHTSTSLPLPGSQVTRATTLQVHGPARREAPAPSPRDDATRRARASLRLRGRLVRRRRRAGESPVLFPLPQALRQRSAPYIQGASFIASHASAAPGARAYCSVVAHAAAAGSLVQAGNAWPEEAGTRGVWPHARTEEQIVLRELRL